MNILHQFQLLLDPFDLVVQFGPYLFVIGDGRQGSLHPEVELDLGLRTRRTDTDTGAVLGIPLKYVALILLQMRLLSGADIERLQSLNIVDLHHERAENLFRRIGTVIDHHPLDQFGTLLPGKIRT